MSKAYALLSGDVTYTQILGVYLNAQVPEEKVLKHEEDRRLLREKIAAWRFEKVRYSANTEPALNDWLRDNPEPKWTYYDDLWMEEVELYE